MPKGKDINSLLVPVREKPIQAYFGQGLHTLGLLLWLLSQTGMADVGSPTALDEANRYLRLARNAIE